MTYTPPAHTPYQWKNKPSTDTPLDEAHLEAAEQDLEDYTKTGLVDLAGYTDAAVAAAQAAAIAASAQGLTPTAVKTGTYTAAAGDFVPADISGGSFTVTLPNAPADKTRIGVKVIKVDGSHANAATVARAGSDVFNLTGGSTSLTLSALFQGVLLQYKASSGIWYVSTADTPIGQANGAGSLDANGRQPIAQSPLSVVNGAYRSVAAPTGVAATDTANIQAAHDALFAAGGGTIILRGGTYVCNLLAWKETIHVRGVRGATILQLASGQNSPLIKSRNFDALVGTDPGGPPTYDPTVDFGINRCSIDDVELDGNAANNQGRSITAVGSTGVFTSTAHGFTAGMVVTLRALTGGTGFKVGEAYYVINTTTNTFQLSASTGGSAITGGTNITAGKVVTAGLLQVYGSQFEIGQGVYVHNFTGIGVYCDGSSRPTMIDVANEAGEIALVEPVIHAYPNDMGDWGLWYAGPHDSHIGGEVVAGAVGQVRLTRASAGTDVLPSAHYVGGSSATSTYRMWTLYIDSTNGMHAIDGQIESGGKTALFIGSPNVRVASTARIYNTAVSPGAAVQIGDHGAGITNTGGYSLRGFLSNSNPGLLIGHDGGNGSIDVEIQQAAEAAVQGTTAWLAYTSNVMFVQTTERRIRVTGGGTGGEFSVSDVAGAFSGPVSGLKHRGPVYRQKETLVSGNYTVLETDYCLTVTAAPVTLTIQDPALTGFGHTLLIKDRDGLASAANPITITPAAGTIDGAASVTITTAHGFYLLEERGTGVGGNTQHWSIVASDQHLATYRLLVGKVGSLIGSGWSNGDYVSTPSGSTLSSATSAGTGVAAVYLDPADYAAPGKTVKVRVCGLAIPNAVAPGSTFTFKLCAMGTPGGASGAAPNVTVGTALASAVIAAPAANAGAHAESADTTLASAGFYVPVFTISGGATAANSQTDVTMTTDYHCV